MGLFSNIFFYTTFFFGSVITALASIAAQTIGNDLDDPPYRTYAIEDIEAGGTEMQEANMTTVD